MSISSDIDMSTEECVRELRQLRAQLASARLTSPDTARDRMASLVVDHLYSFVGLIDNQGRLVFSNQTARIAAEEKETDIGLPFWLGRWWGRDPSARDRARRATECALRGEFVRQEVEIYAGRDLSVPVTVDFTLRPIRDSSGVVIFVVAEGRDVTEAQRARHAADQERRLDLTRAAQRLRASLALVCGPLRELRTTPLSTEVKNTVDLALRNANDASAALQLIAATRSNERTLESRREETTTKPRIAPDRKRLHVLVVDDDVEMSQFLQRILSETYDVDVAFNGAQALQLARTRPPALILSDILMPVMDGEQLLLAIQEHPQLAEIPFILLTVKGDEQARVRMLREGAQDYLMKPFLPDELRVRIANQITASETRSLLRQAFASKQNDLVALAREAQAQKEHLHESLESLRVAREQAERASQQKTNFLHLVSHELRTPLTVLQLHVERLVVQLRERDEERRTLERMQAAITRLTTSVESILEHAQIESGRLTLHLAEIDVRRLVQKVASDYRPAAESKHLEVRVDEIEMKTLRSDPRLLRLILNNLMSNAIKFTDHGIIHLSATRHGEMLHLCVRDTGRGILPELQWRIFEPFEQLEDARHKSTVGIGLGLTLVREMVHALGGRIELDSAPGQGSTFRVVLPAEIRDESGSPHAATLH